MTPEPQSFEQMMDELDAVVAELEDGSIPLELALSRYERGVTLLQTCYARLRGAEQRIQQLTGEDADGRPRLEPFAADATKTQLAPETRRGRRTANDS